MHYQIEQKYNQLVRKVKDVVYRLFDIGFDRSSSEVIEHMDYLLHTGILIAAIEDGAFTNKEEIAVKYLTEQGNIITEVNAVFNEDYSWSGIDYYDQATKNLLISRAKTIAIPHGEMLFSILREHDLRFGMHCGHEIGVIMVEILVDSARIDGLTSEKLPTFRRAASKASSFLSSVAEKYIVR